MRKISIDPRIDIQVVPDGEVHFIFRWTLDDLAQFARAFLAMSEGKLKQGDVSAVFRLRSREAINFLIEELQEAKDQLK